MATNNGDTSQPNQYLDIKGLTELVQYISDNYINVIKITIDGALAKSKLEPYIEDIKTAFGKGKTIIIRDGSGYIIPTVQMIEGQIKLSFLYEGEIATIELG